MLHSDSTKIADVLRIWKDLIDDVTNIIDDDQIITPYVDVDDDIFKII